MAKITMNVSAQESISNQGMEFRHEIKSQHIYIVHHALLHDLVSTSLLTF